MIHENITPIPCSVEKPFLYDLDETYAGQYQACTLFAVSSYEGCALTFHAMIDGMVYSNMPFHALRHKGGSTLELSDLVYKNCPGERIVVNEFDYLQGEMLCYFRKKNLWMRGSYLFTVDWPDDNELFHITALENGQYAALPNHKVKFRSEEKKFPDWKKMHKEWVI